MMMDMDTTMGMGSQQLEFTSLRSRSFLAAMPTTMSGTMVKNRVTTELQSAYVISVGEWV
jgi:hypothetical protein